MKKVQPSGAQNRKKKRAREKAESRQKGALDTWIKKNRVDVEETENNEAAENSSDTSMEPEHNNNSTVSSLSPCQDEDSNREENIDFDIFLQRNDFGYLKKPVSDNLKITIIQHGPERYQNKSCPFAEKDGRSLSPQWFEKVSTNGEIVARKWLLYSPYRQVCYCFVCFLFSKEQFSSNFSKEEGFSSWRKLNPRIKDHETSPSHRVCMREYLNLVVQLQRSATIDAQLQKQVFAEKQKWKAITERIVEVISYLAKQNLALRGHRGEGISGLSKPEETIIDNVNVGNFLATIRLLAKYDVILAEHLQSAKDKPKSVTYLSNRVQNEIIDLLGETIKKKIISEIKDAKYFTIMLDSTPDIGHEEQVSEILRYTHIDENRKVEIKEVFLGFFQIDKKDSGSLVNKILEKLEQDEISITDCRGQTYDNAAVMAGVRGGVQQKILEVNPKAVFVNCENHSLNLACVHASSVHSAVVTFFGLLDKLFSFFSSSTSRWGVLKSFISRTVKRQCQTRWSSRYDAVEVMYEELGKVIASLDQLLEGDYPADTKSDAGALLHSIQQFSFISLLNFWYPILKSVDKVSKRLQDPKMGFHEAFCDLKSLIQILNLRSEEIMRNAVQQASEYCEKWDIPIARRKRKRMLPGQTPQQEINVVMVEVVNRLKTEIEDRSIRLKDLTDRFSFILNLNVIDIEHETEREKLRKNCFDFASYYDKDITAIQLYDDITDFVMLRRARGNVIPSNPKHALECLMQFGRDVFPTLCIAYRLLLTIGFSIASCERSFSKLKLIKTCLRSSMLQERLTSLALISIEREFLSADVKTEVVQIFSDRRAYMGKRNCKF